MDGLRLMRMLLLMQKDRAGLGNVIRDSDGKIVATAAKSSKYRDNVALAEVEPWSGKCRL